MNTILTAKTPLIPPVQKSGSISAPYCEIKKEGIEVDPF